MPPAPRNPDYDPSEDYDFRAEVVAIARARSEATGYQLNARLEHLCERFIQGEISEDEFKFEIIRPYLH